MPEVRQVTHRPPVGQELGRLGDRPQSSHSAPWRSATRVGSIAAEPSARVVPVAELTAAEFGADLPEMWEAKSPPTVASRGLEPYCRAARGAHPGAPRRGRTARPNFGGRIQPLPCGQPPPARAVRGSRRIHSMPESRYAIARPTRYAIVRTPSGARHRYSFQDQRRPGLSAGNSRPWLLAYTVSRQISACCLTPPSFRTGCA